MTYQTAFKAGQEDKANGFNEFNNPYSTEEARQAWRDGFASPDSVDPSDNELRIIHKYASRAQAESEALDYSKAMQTTVTVFKLIDGRYGNAAGFGRKPYQAQEGCSEIAKYVSGVQIF